MVITIEKKELLNAVTNASRFSEKKSATLPALGGIAIVAGDEGIKLRATNLETGIDIRVTGTITTPGVVVVPANTLRELCASFGTTGSITLEHAGDIVVISSETGKSTLKTLPYEDFPILPLPESPKAVFKVLGTDLQKLITFVVSCASTSTIRPELASVFLSSEGGVLKAVATDSFRLAEKKISISGNLPQMSMLIPAKNITDILQVLPETTIEISLNDHQCAFMWETGVLTTRLVSGSYPDYAQIIPKTFIAEATVLRKDIENVLKRVAVFSDTFQKIKCRFVVAEKKLAFTARNNDIGESEDMVSGAITGEDVELSFNHRYISAPLSLIQADTVTISASGIGRAVVMRGTGDTSFLYLVMPMNQ